jgi:hypothetical protein
VIAAYAVASPKSGGAPKLVVLSRAELRAAYDRAIGDDAQTINNDGR